MRIRCFWPILLAAFVSGGQDVIDNPRKPIAEDGGRVVNLREIWRISDAGGDFFFKYPYRMKIAADGSIFIQDHEELLKFSPDGRFIANLFKKGQGPGEMSPQFSYLLDGRDLIIYDSGQRRMWRADAEGRFLNDIPVEKAFRGFILGMYGDNFVYYLDEAHPADARIPGFADIPHMIGLLSKDGKTTVEFQPFFFKRYLIPGGGMNWGNALKTLSLDGRYLYGFHGRDYLIEVMDLDDGKIIRRFRRDYPRIPESETTEQREFRERMKIPKAEFKADIIGLIPDGSRVWAATSTEDPVKGRLWDVFDDRGRYVDCVFIGARRSLLRIAGDMIFVLERGEDETLSLVKYQMVKY
jgi:hypothetical protein